MFKHRDKSNEQQPRGPVADEGCGVGGCGCTGGEPAPDSHTSAESLADQIAKLAAERDEAQARYLRSLADFQNYQRRALENEREAKRQGVTSLLLNIVPVLDHFDLALAHDPGNMTAAQVVDGVRVIREELLKVLGNHGIGIINPAPNDELDPHKHKVLLQQAVPGVEPGRIARTLQVGYTLGDRVVRPANVSAAP